MYKSKALIVAAVALGVTSGVYAQQQPAAPPQLPQAPNMTFFVTGAGPGKGADLGGIEGADQHCQTLGAAPRRGRKDLARLSQHPGGRRQAGRQCARPHRQRPVAEFQGHGRRDQRRRSAQRQQQARLRQLADRARLDHSRRGLRAEPSRRADRLDPGRPRVPGRRGSHLPQLDEQHPGRGDGRPHRPQGVARRRAVTVVEFIASFARTGRRLQPEPICAAPAATGCSTASPRSRGLKACDQGPGRQGPVPFCAAEKLSRRARSWFRN